MYVFHFLTTANSELAFDMPALRLHRAAGKRKSNDAQLPPRPFHAGISS